MVTMFRNSMILFALILILGSNAFASKVKPSLVGGEQYNLEYKVVKTQLLCPKDENGYGCKALGSVITVRTNLKSCVDEVASFDFITYQYGDDLVVEIESRGIKNPSADRVRCAKEGQYTHDIHVVNENYLSVKIVNIHSQL